MNFEIVTPTKAVIHNLTDASMDFLKPLLTYTNTANQHALKRHVQSHWLKNENPDAWQEELKRLQGSVVNTLIFKEGTETYIRPGSIPYLPEIPVRNHVHYPEPKAVAWAHKPTFTFYDYQDLTAALLVQNKHANGQLCTGSGKSAIIMKVCRDTGFRAAIIAPSKSIFDELLGKFEYHLGRVQVGKFGDSRKILGKRFTVCIGDSLVNVKPGTEEWDFFSNLDMMIVDESHTWGAETLDALCHGIFSKVPYRFFLSGTQTRGDGTAKLLQSIIGKTVYTLTTAEAIKKGYIADHEFRIVSLESSNPNYYNRDILKMKRAHFLNNRNIAAFIAKFANAQAANGLQTLVLVEELSQIELLIPMLKVPYAYAHSQKNKRDLKERGLEPVDSDESVEKFNKNEVKVLIGTSCIATGTNIYPTHNTMNWVGGSSEIKTKQGAVGRTVRLFTQSPYCDKYVITPKKFIWDFDVHDVYIMGEQLAKRILYYTDSETEIKRIKFR